MFRFLLVFSLVAFAQNSAFAQLTIAPTEGFSSSLSELPLSATEAWEATVRIDNTSVLCTENNQTTGKRKWGTGVVISYNPNSRIAIVATNSHVVTSCKTGLTSFMIGFLKTGSEKSYATSSSIHILYNQPEIDLAFFEVKVPKKVNAAVAKIALPKSDEKVMAIGYPDLSARKDWTAQQKSKDLKRRLSFGQIRTLAPMYPMAIGKNSEGSAVLIKAPAILHTADILPGNSGGPLINENGEVIGLNTKMIRSLSPKDKERQGSTNYFYCANEVPAVVDCQNLAISSELILKEFEKLNL